MHGVRGVSTSAVTENDLFVGTEAIPRPLGLGASVPRRRPVEQGDEPCAAIGIRLLHELAKQRIHDRRCLGAVEDHHVPAHGRGADSATSAAAATTSRLEKYGRLLRGARCILFQRRLDPVDLLVSRI